VSQTIWTPATGSRPLFAQRGITGLETAIILIAFVVVASVFAFTVLSAGIFASERSKESAYAGVTEARSTLVPVGAVVALRGSVAGTNSIVQIKFTVSIATDAESVDLTPPYTAAATGTAPTVASSIGPTVVSYTDSNAHMVDADWTITWLGNNDGDNLLEKREAAEITVWLHQRQVGGAYNLGSSSDDYLETRLVANNEFSIEMHPGIGAAFQIERTIPVELDAVMNLN
jgi:flagellin FlaB